MKILHVIPSLSPRLGGPTQVALNLVKALRDCAFDAEIVTTNDNGPDLLDVPLYQRTEYEQAPVWFLPRFSPPLKEFIFSPALTQWLWRHIPDYDILDNHYLFSYASTCAGAIARQRNIPYPVRTMGQLAPWALAQSQLKKKLYTALIERHNLNRANAIHCTTVEEAKDVRNFGILTPLVTLPLGVDSPSDWPEAKQTLRQVYNIAATTPIILFLSRLHYKKRPDLLLQALGKLATQNYKFHLILAGSGEPTYLKHLKDLSSSLELTSQITWSGFVTGSDKDRLLHGADLFVLPSFSENFGIAVAEAMAAELPVIVTPGVQIASTIAVAQAGLVVEGKTDALAAAIAQLLDSPNLRRQLGNNGKRLVNQQYTWPAIAQNLSQIYTAIVEGKSLPKFS